MNNYPANVKPTDFESAWEDMRDQVVESASVEFVLTAYVDGVRVCRKLADNIEEIDLHAANQAVDDHIDALTDAELDREPDYDDIGD